MKLSNEMRIGILVTFVAVALFSLTFRVGKFKFGHKGYEIKVHFYRVDGLEVSAPVRLDGFEVGSVKNIRILYAPETRIELDLWLREEAKVREGTKAYVKSMGLLGEKCIELISANREARFSAPGSLIIGQEPVDWEMLLTNGEAIAGNLKEISININERLKINSQAIDETIKNLNVSVKNIASISDNVNERLAVNRQAIDEIVTHLQITSENLEELSADLKLNPWKLLYKEKSKKISEDQ